MATVKIGDSTGPTLKFLLDIHDHHGGYEALFTVAWCYAQRALHGVNRDTAREQGSVFRMGGEVRALTEEFAAAGHRFTNACLAGDETAARLTFDAYVVPDVRRAGKLSALLMELFMAAWMRQLGDGITIEAAPDDAWPPLCDFCVVSPARWTWDCRPFTPTRGDARWELADVRHWYACNACRGPVERRQWGEPYARYRRGGHRRTDPRFMWNEFAAHREHTKARPLPAGRPDYTHEGKIHGR